MNMSVNYRARKDRGGCELENSGCADTDNGACADGFTAVVADGGIRRTSTVSLEAVMATLLLVAAMCALVSAGRPGRGHSD